MVIYMRVISGELKGRIIKGFTLEGTRPTMDRVKESIFSSIQLKVPNSICLDLFAGSGSLGIEAISNGASKCYFVDCNKEAIKVLNKVADKFGHEFNYSYVDIGGCSIDKHGVPITREGMEICKNSDSVLLGAVGGPKWDNVDPSIRPEKALLAVRKELNLFANLRPTKLFPQLKNASPLKAEIVGNGIDLLIVRELTGGVYFGSRETKEVDGELVATDIMPYSESEIERIGRVAFNTAMKRGKRLASVDKANVLDTSRLWRKTMHRIAEEYKEVEFTDILVDNTAMRL